MISNWAIDNHPPLHQHRTWSKEPYEPDLPPELRAMKLGEKGRLLVRSAYIEPLLEPRPTRTAHRMTGAFMRDPAISLGVLGSKQDRTASQLVVGNIGGNVTMGIVLNLNSQTQKDIKYGNPHFSAQMDFHDRFGMPKLDGLKFQVSSHPPYYKASTDNKGGDLAMILRFVKLFSSDAINLVVRLYALDKNQGIAAEGVKGVEPNNFGVHAQSYVNKGSRYITMHESSAVTGRARHSGPAAAPFSDTFRFSIKRENFKALEMDCRQYHAAYSQLDNWRLGTVTINYELNDIGNALYAGAHSGLRVWV